MWHKYIVAAFILLLIPKLPKGSHSLNAAKVNKDYENLFSRNPEVFFPGWFKPRKHLLLTSSPDFPLSSLKNRRLTGDFITFYRCLSRGHGEGAAKLFSLRSSDRMHGSGSRLNPGRLLISGSLYILMTLWSNAGTGLLERYLIPQIGQCLVGI